MIGDPNSNYPPGIDGNHPHISGVSRPGLGAKPTNKPAKSFGHAVPDDDRERYYDDDLPRSFD